MFRNKIRLARKKVKTESLSRGELTSDSDSGRDVETRLCPEPSTSDAVSVEMERDDAKFVKSKAHIRPIISTNDRETTSDSLFKNEFSHGTTTDTPNNKKEVNIKPFPSPRRTRRTDGGSDSIEKDLDLTSSIKVRTVRSTVKIKHQSASQQAISMTAVLYHLDHDDSPLPCAGSSNTIAGSGCPSWTKFSMLDEDGRLALRPINSRNQLLEVEFEGWVSRNEAPSCVPLIVLVDEDGKIWRATVESELEGTEVRARGCSQESKKH
ncbi:hypothetical protein QBC44DRAFT_333942 [Cladorrhinum sp. PSN332]|nr:hypothetical protein QBC44DRAFT_333942 [Cladorrhinum sp. PSN332]